MLLRAGQVVEVERVPRPGRAADVALAQMDARALHPALRVHEGARAAEGVGIRQVVPPVLVEAHRQLQRTEPVTPPRGGCRILHQPRALGPLRQRHPLDVQHGAGGLVVRLQLGVRDFRRPAAVEGVAARLDRDVRVDERSAADAGALHHAHVREHAQVEPAVLLFGMLHVEEPGIVRLPRKRLRRPAPAAFEHDHPRARLGQTAREHCASKSAADDDDIRIGHGRELLVRLRRGRR